MLIALWADGTPFEYRMLDDEHPENMEELKRHWPFGQFPLLLDDGEPVVETTCIIEHLQAHHPGPNRWIPDGELGRRVRFLDRFFDLYVMDNMTVPVFDAIRPEGSRDPYGVEQAHGAAAHRLRLARGQSRRRAVGGRRRVHPGRLRRRAVAVLRRLGRGDRPDAAAGSPPIARGCSPIRSSRARSTRAGPTAHFFPLGAPDRD